MSIILFFLAVAMPWKKWEMDNLASSFPEEKIHPKSKGEHKNQLLS